VKALAFGSRTTIYLEALTRLLEATLDTIFNKTDINLKPEQNIVIATGIIEDVFKSINKHASVPIPRGNFMQRAVGHDLNTNLAWNLPVEQDSMDNRKDSLFYTKIISIDRHPIISSKIVVPLTASLD
jgi:hypothetical protein